jgi:DNA-binding IclR family transcriptional regulator
MPPVRLSRAVRKLLQEFEAQESPQTESCIHIDLMADLGMTKTTFHRRLQTLKDLKLIGNAGRGKSALTFLGREVLRQEER